MSPRASSLLLLLLLLLAGCGLKGGSLPPEAFQGAYLGLQEAGRADPLCRTEVSLDRKVWYRFDMRGECAVWPGKRLGAAPVPGGEVLTFGFWVREESRPLGRSRAEVFLPRYPVSPAGYAWVFLEGPREVAVPGPVYAGTPLRERKGLLTVSASCPKPVPGRCLEKPRPQGPRKPLYWPEAPVPTLGREGEARDLARKGGLFLGEEAWVALKPSGKEAVLSVRGRGSYRLGPGYLVDGKGRRSPFNGMVWAGLLKVEAGEAGSLPLTLAGEVVEGTAPLSGESLGLLSEGPLRLLGSGEVRAALLARRGRVEVAEGVRVVGSVAAYQYAPLPLTFRPSEPPGFPALESPGPLILGLKPLR